MSKNCTNDGCSCTPNMSIKCSVTSCAHHCQDMDNCGQMCIRDRPRGLPFRAPRRTHRPAMPPTPGLAPGGPAWYTV